MKPSSEDKEEAEKSQDNKHIDIIFHPHSRSRQDKVIVLMCNEKRI